MQFIVLICLFIFGFIVICCNSQVCLPSWTGTPNQNVIYAQNLPGPYRLQDCLGLCEYNLTQCVGVDYDYSTATADNARCWVHTNASDYTDDNTYDTEGTNSYRINRTCSNVPGSTNSDCPVTWIRAENMDSLSNGIGVPYATEFDCVTYCRYTTSCIGVTYNNASSQPCAIHTAAYDMVYTKSSPGVVMYQINRTSCTDQPATKAKSIGRCSGQMFKNADWCEKGKMISITSTSTVYKTHPLCCSGSYPMDVSPPDNSMLSWFSIQFLDSDFFNQINSSCQGQNNCSFVARSAVAGFINNPYCPRDPQKANYVVISFSCLGPEDLTTTTQPPTTTTTQPPTGTLSTFAPYTNGVQPQNMPQNSQMSDDKAQTALVLGAIGVAFSCLCLILIAAIIGYYIWLRKRPDNVDRIQSQSSMNGDNAYATVQGVNPCFTTEGHDFDWKAESVISNGTVRGKC